MKRMTKLLEKAFEEAGKLPAGEQDSLAQWLLAELESETRWSEQFASSADKLAILAQRALSEHAAGETTDLDPEAI
jgi:hypothetical protein